MHCDFMRVECTTMKGVPDINACNEGVEIWIESKIFYEDHGSPLLEKEQHAWGFRRSFYGGRVWVLAYHEDADLIHCYKHPLTVTPARGYLRITSARTQLTIPRHEPLALQKLFLL
jgi:hypothetical protein